MTTSSLKALLARILVSASFFMVVAADHFTCSWTGPSTKDPDQHGYSKFCEAGYSASNVGRGRYLFGDSIDTKVADWGFLHPETIEFGTPCNGGGYGGDSCLHGKYWGVCIEENDYTRDCRYLSKWDDCEWPTKFNNDTRPSSVSIWYQK
ncbi:hypothetical protein BDZ90DRAFT_259682 [Jaminaea rosea]|uniref:Secreted protein n=1 Tax=Jaminaea rosea TaxID=1569628 RepID=A0A316UUI2_9BASI|nr:hypothetical protein BDZ90DRAFT_259682 [Jaminaea rosea]PWN28654.1 hypothetical protein BDZ90DRAFT_259682 [Jaminaea rosea]